MPHRNIVIALLTAAAASLTACTTVVTPTDTGDTGADYSEPEDAEPVTYGWSGTVAVTPGESLTGNESLVFTADDGTVLCQLDTTLAMVAVLDICPECTWAFEVNTTAATLSTSEYCESFRIEEGHGVDTRFGLGFIDGVSGQLLSGNTTEISTVEGATVDWNPETLDNAKSPGTLTYSWPIGTTEYIPNADSE